MYLFRAVNFVYSSLKLSLGWPRGLRTSVPVCFSADARWNCTWLPLEEAFGGTHISFLIALFHRVAALSVWARNESDEGQSPGMCVK